MFWMAAACTGTGSSTIVPLDTGTGGTFPDFGPELVVAQEEIGTYTAEWVFPSTTLAANSEIYLAWDGLTADAWDVERPADSYAAVALLRAATDRLDLADRLANGTVEEVLTGVWFAPTTPGQVDIALSEIGGFDPVADFGEDPAVSWLFALCDSDQVRLDVRTGMVLIPSATSAGTIQDVPPGAGGYTWQARLESGLRTEPGYDAYAVDFSAVTTDLYGQPMDPATVDELFVGRFEGVADADDLASVLHTAAEDADGWWTMPLQGQTSVDLSAAQGPAGAFPGFEEGASYLVGARCTTCFEPAPAWAVPVTVR